jgi:hypothetical protein
MSAITRVDRCAALPSLRAMVRAVIPSLSWRHHGIGALQGYVSEGGGVETRIHVWDPRLIKPGMAESGSVHDHRFEMVSHVLAGVVGHEEWIPYADDDGDHTTFALTHARAAASTKFHGPIAPTGERFTVRINPFVIHEGHTYRFAAQAFHRSPVPAFAVTCVEKHKQRDVPARVLHPIGREPIMAFGHDMDHTLVDDVVRCALEALS